MSGGEPGAELRQTKAAMRREAMARRKALDPVWRAEASAAITRRVLELPEIGSAGTVALYASFGHEIDTHPLIHELIRRKGSVALPCALRGPTRLEFRRIRAFPEGCLSGYQGILEPNMQSCPEIVEIDRMDVILVPGLLFDRRGYRVGYGGGYYDLLLAQPHAAHAIGLAFSPLLVDEPLPTGPWDRPVDAICTETGVLEIKSLSQKPEESQNSA
jgi:5-formyltetrahydrofolate cyclo-ligase